MATPYKMKNSALHKSATHGSPMQNNYDKVKKAAKAIYEATVPPGLQKVNEKIVNKLKGDKSKTKSEVVDFSKKDSNYKVQFTKSKPETTTQHMRKNLKVDKIPRRDTVAIPVVNNDTRPPKKTSMATMKKGSVEKMSKTGAASIEKMSKTRAAVSGSSAEALSERVTLNLLRKAKAKIKK